jgi:hypothetical protein
MLKQRVCEVIELANPRVHLTVVDACNQSVGAIVVVLEVISSAISSGLYL